MQRTYVYIKSSSLYPSAAPSLFTLLLLLLLIAGRLVIPLMTYASLLPCSRKVSFFVGCPIPQIELNNINTLF